MLVNQARASVYNLNNLMYPFIGLHLSAFHVEYCSLFSAYRLHGSSHANHFYMILDDFFKPIFLNE